MPRRYPRHLGGAAKTAHPVALSPADHGTSLRGPGLLARAFPGGDALLGASCRACAQRRQGHRGDQPGPGLGAGGPEADDYFGEALATIDWNTDGFTDLVVGTATRGARSTRSPWPARPG